MTITKKRFLIDAPMLASGLPDTTGIDHATLDGGRGQPWFDEVCITDNTVSPQSYVDFFTGQTVWFDLPVRDDNFVFFPYSLHPAIDGRYPAFQFLRTAPILAPEGGALHARGLLFIDVENSDGQPMDAVAAVFGGLLSQITILAVENISLDQYGNELRAWTPSNAVTVNENLAVLS